jgi:hypothetical protein
MAGYDFQLENTFLQVSVGSLLADIDAYSVQSLVPCG